MILYSSIHDFSFAYDRLETQIRMEIRNILIDMPDFTDFWSSSLLISILIVNLPLFRFGLLKTREITVHKIIIDPG